MFKKLKDKLAEEVKSSPQRIQQIAQAAQAAVTSASSSISDITNNDLFSIGDTDSQKTVKLSNTPGPRDGFQDVSLLSQTNIGTVAEVMDNQNTSDVHDHQRQRRFSNSSFASDVSFKLPSYESPAMYHLQSDMDVSASEAEERGLTSPGGMSLDRVTKDQLYAAYRRTQERYKKYRTQYADLARHYKLLERENAKARSVLVETQDKALRRISELREQSTLEQSAKAHLEQALRLEIDERNMKIQSLTTKVKLLESNSDNSNIVNTNTDDNKNKQTERNEQLIDLSTESDNHTDNDDQPSTEHIQSLNNKIDKMEQLLSKYKESLKSIKEKNAQLTTELQVATNELDIKKKENEELKLTSIQLNDARQSIQELTDKNEELQNKLNTYDFSKTKEVSTLETDLQNAQEEIKQLQSKITIFSKREEEYAISLAENKLSIHKELESKEAEIKKLKDSVSASNQELQSLNIVINDYKDNIAALEDERVKLKQHINELNHLKNKTAEKEIELDELKQKYTVLEQSKLKIDEEYQCLQLQAKQETAEKLAMMDRNAYLENKNKLITEENVKKTSQLSNLESEISNLKLTKSNNDDEMSNEKAKLFDELTLWKQKYNNMQSEIEEERVELVKLQSEIEKLLTNYKSLQSENSKLNLAISHLQTEKSQIQQELIDSKSYLKKCFITFKDNIMGFREFMLTTKNDLTIIKNYQSEIQLFNNKINELLKLMCHINESKSKYNALESNLKTTQDQLDNVTEEYNKSLSCIKSLESERNNLLQKLDKLQIEKHSESQESENIIKEKIELKNLVETLTTDLKEKEKQYKNLLDEFEKQKSTNSKQVENLKSENKVLLSETDDLKKLIETMSKEFEQTKIELVSKNKNTDDQFILIQQLENNFKVATEENISLKSKFESMVVDLKKLEDELTDVRHSHSKLEEEKDRLNSVIELFEKNETAKLCQETQTKNIEQEALNSALEENNILKSKCEQIKQEKESLFEKVMTLEQHEVEMKQQLSEKDGSIVSLNTELLNLKEASSTQISEIEKLKSMNLELTKQISDSDNLENAYKNLKTDFDILKEENRRLLSDIEGLQTYLGKISKENSVLNDKLREFIANGEHTESHEVSSLLQNIDQLKNEVQLEKEKSEELVRQNNILTEENFELKDQLQNSHTSDLTISDNSGSEIVSLRDKCNNLLQQKNDLEHKLAESELMSKSASSNMKQLQDNNQKLRSSNDKLERRLDEALVSLRHLHSLQENTELEYLRNILYEYLTGSGTHSVTLAKVLAAVVKFDDQQTNIVLQKEKERQGLLRQLGLL